MTAVRELRSKNTIVPIKTAFLGGYHQKQTEEYISRLEEQLREAQENYSDKTTELKERIDSISSERNRIVLQEKATAEKANLLFQKCTAFEAENALLKFKNNDVNEKLALITREAGIDLTSYTQLCSDFSSIKDEAAALKAENEELHTALASRQSEICALTAALQKALAEKDDVRSELYAGLQAAREDRDIVCSRFYDAASKQKSAADSLKISLDEVMSLLDSLALDAATLSASLPFRSRK